MFFCKAVQIFCEKFNPKTQILIICEILSVFILRASFDFVALFYNSEGIN